MTDATAGYSDPYAAPPVLARHVVTEPVRAVPLILLLLGLLGLALLITRSGAGPFPPLVVGVLGFLLYAVFSDARWRLEVWAANGFAQVGRGTTADLLIDVSFFTFVVLFSAAFIVLAYITLAAWLPPPDHPGQRLPRGPLQSASLPSIAPSPTPSAPVPPPRAPGKTGLPTRSKGHKRVAPHAAPGNHVARPVSTAPANRSISATTRANSSAIPPTPACPAP